MFSYRRSRAALAAAAVAISLAAITGCRATASPEPASTPVRIDGADPLATATRPPPASPPGAVLTQRGDDTRLGWNAAESRLTVASVSADFGKRAAYPVDGKIYAQPLYAPGLTVGGTVHNVVVVATEHDSVYAFDADTAAATPLWHTSVLLPGAHTFDAAHQRVGAGVLCESVLPEVGINSTPVIDWTTKTLYLVALDVEKSAMTYRVHALDLATGRDVRVSRPMTGVVNGKANDADRGRVTFTSREQQQRMGLALVDGVVYAGFASWCGSSPYHGWVLGYRADDLTRTTVYNSTPDYDSGGFWESSGGITVDPHGHLVLVSGNGPYDLDTGGTDLGDTVLKLTPQDGTLRVADSFTPFDQTCRFRHDEDLGSGSPLLVPGHDEYVLSSKTGAVYVLDAGHLGGYTPLDGDPCTHQDRTDVDRIKQELTVGSVVGGMWGTWAYWRGSGGEYVYSGGSADRLTQWRLGADGRLDPKPVAQAPEAFAYPGAIPVVSSNGSTTGTAIVWTIDQNGGPATLRAFDASDIGHEIWNSARDPGRDGLDNTGEFNHFQVPTVAGGKVFIGGQSHLLVYG